MLRRLLTVTLILGLVGTALTVWSGRAAAGDASEQAPDAVSSRLVERDGRVVGEILIGPAVVFRIRAPLGAFTVEERTNIVAARLSDAIGRGIMPYHFGLDYSEGAVVLTAQCKQVVTVDRPTAELAGGSPLSTAIIWLKNLRRALGWEPFVASRSPLASRGDRTWYGVASWYGPGFQGRTTANGDKYDMNGYTAAHKSVPFGSRLMITSIETGLSVVVTVNDRGPFIAGRELDLSRAAAAAIGLIGYGVGQVRIDYIR